MANSDLTKGAIAASLRELMGEMPLSAVTVQEIAQRCGINRNTFYYHFRDKYDVVNWIFHKEVEGLTPPDTQPQDWGAFLIRIGRCLMEHKTFYRNALEEVGQNSFTFCLLEYCQGLVAGMIRRLDAAGAVSESDIHFVSQFYALALIGSVAKWAKDGMNTDPERFVRDLERMLRGDMLRPIRTQMEINGIQTG